MKLKTQKRILPAIAAVIILGAANLAHAQTTTTTSVVDNAAGTPPSLFLPQYDSATLTAQGCDPNVMTRLNNDYIKKRGLEQQIQGYQAKQLLTAAPPGTPDCYTAALNNLENAMGPIRKLIALYENGSGDAMSSIESAILTQLKNMACSQASSYTSQLSYGLTSSISSTKIADGYTIGTVSNTINSSLTNTGTVNASYIGNSVVNQATPLVGTNSLSTVLGNPFK